MVSLLALCWIGEFAISLIAAGYLVEVWLLLGGIDGTKLLGAFEHQVLQIVSQTSSLGRVITRTCFYSDVDLQARLLLVN